MTKSQITRFLKSFSGTKSRTIIIVDFANVDKWEESLNWTVGVKKLSQLIKHFSQGKKYLRRFYYGRDYGPNQKSTRLKPWSKLSTLGRNTVVLKSLLKELNISTILIMQLDTLKSVI